jgi:hypothetical protein
MILVTIQSDFCWKMLFGTISPKISKNGVNTSTETRSPESPMRSMNINVPMVVMVTVAILVPTSVVPSITSGVRNSSSTSFAPGSPSRA